MKIPSKLDILGKEYKVIKRMPRKNYRILEKNEGFTIYSDQVIVIRSDLKKDMEEEVLLHELIHAIDSSNAIGLSEEQVQALTCGLRTVGKANKLRVW